MDERFNLRLEPEDKMLLKAIAKRHGRTPGSYLRKHIWSEALRLGIYDKPFAIKSHGEDEPRAKKHTKRA